MSAECAPFLPMELDPDPVITGHIPDDFTIEPITYGQAMHLAETKHYMHRRCPCSAAFGLIGRNGHIYGFIVYGTPSSAPLRSGIAGPEHAKNVVELTRLWVDDRVPRNGESFLIGNTLRRAGKEIVVSFAEIAAGHVGTVYQATNWIYTGLSAKRPDWVVDGIDKHGQTWGDQYTANELRAKFGDRFRSVERPRKHRYVFINARGKRRAELIGQLRYATQPYPKRDEIAA